MRIPRPYDAVATPAVDWLRHESSIIWVRGRAANYDYLREHQVQCSSGRRRIPMLDRSTLVALTLLRHGTPPGPDGLFQRRIWRSKPSDPVTGGELPLGAVRPSSIRIGQPSKPGRE